MTGRIQPSAWLLMAAGENRQYGGNSGYDDLVDAYYTWDSTVQNYRNLQVGDRVALWDKHQLLGVSVIEDITSVVADKIVFRCPKCSWAHIARRAAKTPEFRCLRCKAEFDHPFTVAQTVTEYTARHDAAWTPLTGLLTGDELRPLCHSPKSILSMRALDWAGFRAALEARGEHRAVSRILGRSPGIIDIALPPPPQSSRQPSSPRGTRLRQSASGAGRARSAEGHLSASGPSVRSPARRPSGCTTPGTCIATRSLANITSTAA